MLKKKLTHSLRNILVAGACLYALVPIFSSADPTTKLRPQNYPAVSVTFDPSKCSEDPHGMVYIALGKKVFRHAYQNIIPSQTTDHEHYTPPKPSDPLGCPGNPIQGTNLITLFFTDIIKSESPTITRNNIFVSLYNDDAKVRYPQNTIEELYAAMCRKPMEGNKPIIDDRFTGLKGCLLSSSCKGVDKGYQTTDYLTPMDGKITLYCKGLSRCSDSENSHTCTAAYKLEDYINLQYGFMLQEISLDRFIELDKQIRQRIEAAEVKNYPWINSPTNKK